MTPGFMHEYFATSYSSLFFGCAMTVGISTALLAVRSYLMFRHKALLWFGAENLTSFLFLTVVNLHPMVISGEKPDLMFVRVIQGMVIFLAFFYFQLIRSAFRPLPTLRFPPKTFHAITAVNMALKVAIVIDPTDTWLIRTSAVGMAVYMVWTFLIALAYPGTNQAVRLIKTGCALHGLGFLTYPLVRSGLIPLGGVAAYAQFIMMGTAALYSMFWFLGLVELARETHDRRKTESTRALASMMVSMRHLIAAPLRTIEDATQKLKSPGTTTDDARLILEASLKDLQELNAQLEKLEVIRR